MSQIREPSHEASRLHMAMQQPALKTIFLHINLLLTGRSAIILLQCSMNAADKRDTLTHER